MSGKDLGLIASGGRTGTAFLGEFLSEMVPESYSVHEPDVWPGLSREALRRIGVFGLKHMVVDRLRGRSGFRNLSLRHIRGELTSEESVDEIQRQRMSYYESLPQPLVIESNYQCFGVVPEFRKAFPDSRVAVLVRHPETWVASYLDYATRRGGRDRVQRWGQSRLHPEMVGDEEYVDRWDDMSRFERLCWDWKIINGALVRAAETDPVVRLFRYEDLFLASNRKDEFRELLTFLTDFGDRSYDVRFDPEALQQRVNVRPAREGDDSLDTVSRPEALVEICGGLMADLGYDVP